jgi:hypothetical protein
MIILSKLARLMLLEQFQKANRNMKASCSNKIGLSAKMERTKEHLPKITKRIISKEVQPYTKMDFVLVDFILLQASHIQRNNYDFLTEIIIKRSNSKSLSEKELKISRLSKNSRRKMR